MFPPRARMATILTLALPIIGSMVSQNILNLVDTWMVGELGTAALAAVGLGGIATFASQAVILGLSAGVQALAARRKGEGVEDQMAIPLNGGLLLSLLLGAPIALLLYTYATEIFQMLNDDPEVVELGAAYYRTRLIGVVAVGANFSFRGYWNGVGLSKMYMRTIVLMHISNIFLSYSLIFGVGGIEPMGVVGAGAGTTASVFLGTIIYTFLGFRHARAEGFLRGLPSTAELGSLLKLSIPNSIQQFFFALGLNALFWIVGKVGTHELAAANVLINLTLVAILPAMGLGLAAASLVGQALGRGEPEDAEQWGWDVVALGAVLLAFLGAPYVLATDFILGQFLKGPDGIKAIAVAHWPLRILGMSMPLEAFGMVLMNALLGAGDAKRVMQVSIVTQWGIFLPVAYYVGPVLGYGLVGIWSLQVGYRALQTLCFVALWRQGKWKTVKV